MVWKKALDWLNLILGLWLIISPWALGAASALAFTWTAVILGVCLAGVSIWALVRARDTTPEWSIIVLGALVFIAPWVLGFYGLMAAAWNAWLVGVAAVVIAALTFPELWASTGLHGRPGHSH